MRIIWTQSDDEDLDAIIVDKALGKGPKTWKTVILKNSENFLKATVLPGIAP